MNSKPIIHLSRTRLVTAAFAMLSIFATARVAAAHGSASPLSCADRSVSAGAVRAPQDLRAFVQCAYEYVQQMGRAEAKRAFHEDPRWNSGSIYVFVSEVSPISGASRSIVFPPDPMVEGTYWDPRIDAFGSDLFLEVNRVVSSVGEGWVYYAFNNPETGATEPKITYVKSVDWEGAPAAIGAGVYRRDLPGTCNEGEVNAATLADNPSPERLQEFVRCAAMELESKGYFAIPSLSSDPRWRHGQTYLFGLDLYGYQLFSGNPLRGQTAPELVGARTGSSAFGMRDFARVADTFGETFLYFPRLNLAALAIQTKMTFVTRAVVYGLPILVGSGYFLDERPGEGQGGEPGESGTQYGLSDTARESRGGVELVISYDSTRKVFTGTVRNTTSETVRQVRVEVHLSNGVELGPTPNVSLVAGQTRSVELDASSQTFDKFSVHVEIGSGEHGGGGEGGEHGGGGEGGREGGGG